MIKEGSLKILIVNVTNFLITFDLSVDTLRLPLHCQIWYFSVLADRPQEHGFAEINTMDFERDILSVTGVH